jgi:hypothetical protein
MLQPTPNTMAIPLFYTNLVANKKIATSNKQPVSTEKKVSVDAKQVISGDEKEIWELLQPIFLILTQTLKNLENGKLPDEELKFYKNNYPIFDAIANVLESALDELYPDNEYMAFLISFGDKFIEFVDAISKEIWKDTFATADYLKMEGQILEEIKKGEFEDVELLCSQK